MKRTAENGPLQRTKFFGRTLVLADNKHYTIELISDVRQRTGFDLLVSMSIRKSYRQAFQKISEDQFARRWAGFVTTRIPFELNKKDTGEQYQFVQRFREQSEEYGDQGFLCTSDRDELDLFIGHRISKTMACG